MRFFVCPNCGSEWLQVDESDYAACGHCDHEFEISSATGGHEATSAVKHETEPDTGSCVFSVRNKTKGKVHES